MIIFNYEVIQYVVDLQNIYIGVGVSFYGFILKEIIVLELYIRIVFQFVIIRSIMNGLLI